MNWQEKRSEVWEKSTKGKYLKSSLQCLSNDNVLLLLESILQRSKDGALRNDAVKGLRAVQEHLMYGYGYLDLEKAHHLHSSFNELSCPDKQAFRFFEAPSHYGLFCLPFQYIPGFGEWHFWSFFFKYTDWKTAKRSSTNWRAGELFIKEPSG